MGVMLALEISDVIVKDFCIRDIVLCISDEISSHILDLCKGKRSGHLQFVRNAFQLVHRGPSEAHCGVVYLGNIFCSYMNVCARNSLLLISSAV